LLSKKSNKTLIDNLKIQEPYKTIEEWNKATNKRVAEEISTRRPEPTFEEMMEDSVHSEQQTQFATNKKENLDEILKLKYRDDRPPIAKLWEVNILKNKKQQQKSHK
jgi:hypothetical protein